MKPLFKVLLSFSSVVNDTDITHQLNLVGGCWSRYCPRDCHRRLLINHIRTNRRFKHKQLIIETWVQLDVAKLNIGFLAK